ncbi:MAG TPA: tRNA (adenosine(37)-N6)-dimethylallyltransferase MiaA [Candidatus Saccharimonadales bacterium]|nr:tRNA (adenosine(37)-N6)-dimethylallyltransferase MiaA [Candidatus Saccharimonadales bacterium]
MAGVAPLLVIVGPTSSGKTSFAIKMAQKYKGEIISADSRTIYRGMDIGTAKPTEQDIKKNPHHLINIVDPDQRFTVADFKKMATKTIDEVWNRGKIPIMVGGSGLFIDSVIYNYSFGRSPGQHDRESLNELSIEELQAKCKELGISLPENSTNKRYLVRAIEVGGLSKKDNVVRDNTLIVGIYNERTELKNRIERRLEQMLQSGVIEETKKLSKKYGWNCEPMKSNIYRSLRGYLNDEIDLDQAKQEIIKSDIRLAKKQMTWFKRNKSIVWGVPDELEPIIDNFVKKIN